MPAWAVPAGDEVAFDFTVAWGIPAGDEVAFAFAPSVYYILPAGFASSAFGAAVVAHDLTQLVYPFGFASGDFGAPSLTPGAATLAASGWTSGSIGTATVINAAQLLLLGGIAPPPSSGPNSDRQLPDPMVSYYVRYVLPAGVAPPTISTAHVIAQEIQFIDLAGRGPYTWASGTALVADALRYVSPPSVLSGSFGAANVAYIQIAAPAGWESSTVSAGGQVDINLQRVFPDSGADDPAGYGATAIRNQFEYLRPTSWLSEAIGFPVAYNLDQVLLVAPYMNTTGDPTGWPSYSPFVENKDRVLGPGGWRSSKFSTIGNTIENTARALDVPGTDLTAWGVDTFISHFIRDVYPAGWDSFYSSQYAVVYNNAAVIAPSGWASTAFGTPNPVLNLNRTILQHTGWAGPIFGTPFVAYALRTVLPGPFNDVPAGLPEVRFNPCPIAPTGWESYRSGGQDVYERFNIIRAFSANVHPVPLIGEPSVRNRNQTVLVYPSVQTLFGTQRIFNYIQNLQISGHDGFVVGLHNISYRTKTLVPQAISPPVFSVLHRAHNVIPDPPARQLVFPPSMYLGSPVSPGEVPAPSFNYATIFPESLLPGLFGTPLLARNTLAPNGIGNLLQVGTPTFVFTQLVLGEGFGIPYPRAGSAGPDGSIGESDLLDHRSAPRITPYTIYAPSADQATGQARANHPPNSPHAIDALQGSTYPWWGVPEVSNQFREIGPVPNHSTLSLGPSSRFGDGTLTLRRQYVLPQPVRSQRFGLPVLLGAPQYITFTWYGGWESLEFSALTIARAPVREMPAPAGIFATEWGMPKIELFNREVAPDGVPHRGNPQEGFTNPWGLPLVGFPRVYGLGGYVFTLWGTPRVEHRIRNLYPIGWVSSLDSEDDLSSWNDRMRVTRRTAPGSIPGIASTSVLGAAVVAFAIRGVLGRGFSGYNSGDHAVKGAFRLYVGGWDSLEVGDIDRWEADKIKPHGDSLGFVGTPRLLHPMPVLSIYDGECGNPRIAVPLYLSGIPEIGFDGPSVSNPFGCTNRVVTPLPILSQQNVPEPAVS